MSWPFLVALVALAGIAWLAYVSYLDHKTTTALGKPGGAGLEEALREMLARLEESEAERARLRQRVENLEAIVTSEQFDLDREAQQALRASRPAAEAAPRLALDEEAGEEASAPTRDRRRER
jgi:hypothetical protein